MGKPEEIAHGHQSVLLFIMGTCLAHFHQKLSYFGLQLIQSKSSSMSITCQGHRHAE